MRRFMRYFTRDTGLNDVIVHELMFVDEREIND